jgi:hypothetical protein
MSLRRAVAPLSAVTATLALAACGSSSSSAAPKVGACVDASNQVVSCSSSSAKQTLVSDQDAPNAIACIVIGDKPQVRVTVGGHHFCAEPK